MASSDAHSQKEACPDQTQCPSQPSFMAVADAKYKPKHWDPLNCIADSDFKQHAQHRIQGTGGWTAGLGSNFALRDEFLRSILYIVPNARCG